MDSRSPEGSSLLALLDAFPSLAFIADAETRVLEANRAARQWLGERTGASLGLLLGNTFHCIFPHESRGDCGTTEFCPGCFVRGSIEAAAAGKPAPRRLAHMIVRSQGEPEDRWFQVSASPLRLEGQDRVLVVLEDATQLVELRALLPVCPGCGSRREAGDPVEQALLFLRKHPDFLLADELCADCRQRPPEAAGGEPHPA